MKYSTKYPTNKANDKPRVTGDLPVLNTDLPKTSKEIPSRRTNTMQMKVKIVRMRKYKQYDLGSGPYTESKNSFTSILKRRKKLYM